MVLRCERSRHPTCRDRGARGAGPDRRRLGPSCAGLRSSRSRRHHFEPCDDSQPVGCVNSVPSGGRVLIRGACARPPGRWSCCRDGQPLSLSVSSGCGVSTRFGLQIGRSCVKGVKPPSPGSNRGLAPLRLVTRLGCFALAALLVRSRLTSLGLTRARIPETADPRSGNAVGVRVSRSAFAGPGSIGRCSSPSLTLRSLLF
jgi:hypothetical protein